MQLVTELALPELPVDKAGFGDDPMPFYEMARLQHPWLAKFSQGYVVHGYQATKDLIGMDDKLSPGFTSIIDFYGARGTPWGRFMEEAVIQRSGPDHTRLRDSVAAAFTPRSANQARTLMRKIISDLLDEWAPKGEFDFGVFASYFPVSVLCGLLGVSSAPIPAMRNVLETQHASLSLNRDLWPTLVKGHDIMWNFADKLVIDRETTHSQDEGTLLDSLIAAKNSGQMDDTELRFMLMTLLIAGYDTSKNMLTLIMYMMLPHQADWDRCAKDKAFCGKVVEEILRHSGPTTPYRMVAQEFDYNGVRFPKDTVLIFATYFSGRDPLFFPKPNEFDPERVHTHRNVAFGRGAHGCLGQHIARTQLEEGLHMIAQRIKNPRLVGEVTYRAFLGVWGINTLPIAFDVAPAGECPAN